MEYVRDFGELLDKVNKGVEVGRPATIWAAVGMVEVNPNTDEQVWKFRPSYVDGREYRMIQRIGAEEVGK